MSARKKCGAKTKSGGKCKYPAGHGTDHPGFGSCNLHFGATANASKAAAKEMAATLGYELDMEPHDALIWMVKRAAGAVAYWTAQVSDLEKDAVIVTHRREREWEGTEGGGTETVTSTSAELNIAVQAMNAAEERLVRFAKVAIDAGIAERQVRAAEQYGQVFADAVRTILDGLGLTAKQQAAAPAVVERAFRVLEGGKSQAPVAA